MPKLYDPDGSQSWADTWPHDTCLRAQDRDGWARLQGAPQRVPSGMAASAR
jgi:hypothetical protein